MGSWGCGVAGEELLLPTPRVCDTPQMGLSLARLALGTGLSPAEEPTWGYDSRAGRGDVTGTGEECVAPPASTQGCPQGCRQAGHAGRHGAKAGRGGRARQGALAGRAGGGVQVEEGAPALSRLIADPPGRGCGTCQNSGFNYLRGAAGNQHAGSGGWVHGAGASQRGGSEGLI